MYQELGCLASDIPAALKHLLDTHIRAGERGCQQPGMQPFKPQRCANEHCSTAGTPFNPTSNYRHKNEDNL
ncbi:Protein of unknown function [Gryllus bimaculatus]|nr:Protein of unknown function [Gryllus bimaculatus]